MSGPAAQRIAQFVGKKTIWAEMGALAARTKAINLGQGFPSNPPPRFATEALVEAARSATHHTYSRSQGTQRLTAALKKRYDALLGREVDAAREIVTTAGATEALFCALQGLVDPGDEVLVFAPAFDIYGASVETAGGRVVPVQYRADGVGGGWRVDMAELEAAVTPRSKVLLLNSPWNPGSKVWTRDELEALAEVVRRHPRLVVISDEVYEYFVFDGAEHVPFAQLPGMYERTITVSSAGKLFATTGWKVGWAVAPPALAECVALVKQWTSFSTCSVVQEAVAVALERVGEPYEGHATYVAHLQASYRAKRDVLMAGLEAAGLAPHAPQGSFFILADTSRVRVPPAYFEGGAPRDLAFCRFLAEEVGVVAIPPSAFHTPENVPLAANLARFAFCKTDEELREASERLRGLAKHLKAEE